jgi:hypothetical protein
MGSSTHLEITSKVDFTVNGAMYEKKNLHLTMAFDFRHLLEIALENGLWILTQK